MQAAVMAEQWVEARKKTAASQYDEMWNGILHMPPMPNRWHQNVARDLLIYLTQHWAKPRGCRVNQEINLTTPEDEAHWTHNYRSPDLVLLDPPRFGIDKIEYMVGAPLVVVEIHSSGDESFEKQDFYASLGTPETWIIERSLKFLELRQLGPDGQYSLVAAGSDGWLRSPATGVEFQIANPGKLMLRMRGDDVTLEEIVPSP